MIKKCTPQFVRELEVNVKEGKIEFLKVEFQENKGYFADYKIVDEPLDLTLENRLYTASILNEFAAMLEVDKVYTFSIHYEPLKDVCVVGKSYSVSVEDITRDVKLDKVRQDLIQNLQVIKEIGISDTVIPEVYEKSTKQNVGQKQNNAKVRYTEVSLENVIKKILEVIK